LPRQDPAARRFGLAVRNSPLGAPGSQVPIVIDSSGDAFQVSTLHFAPLTLRDDDDSE